MTKEEARNFYPILQAYAEGRVIECRTKPSAVKGTDVPNDWTEMKEIKFWNNTEYRIKPEPKYRPFKDRQECWQEMQKHQPFGWIADIDSCRYILAVGEGSVVFKSFNSSDFCKSFDEVVDTYTFADGTTFGIKVEE
jgi:hypothetical protein